MKMSIVEITARRSAIRQALVNQGLAKKYDLPAALENRR
jgi:hypothetical protein